MQALFTKGDEGDLAHEEHAAAGARFVADALGVLIGMGRGFAEGLGRG